MPKFKLIPFASVAIAFLILVALSLQYPLSTTFPIGGDAPFYIIKAKSVLDTFENPVASYQSLRASWYPLSIFIFSTSSILPIDWASRFTWYMTLSHILIGLILARLLYRANGWPAAAMVMIIWAVTTTEITRHVEDGTLAQLISFIFLALFLERIAAGATWSALVALFALTFSHPINVLALLIIIVLTTPILLASWKDLAPNQKKQVYVIYPLSLILLILIVFAGKISFSGASAMSGVSTKPFIDIIVSRFAPFVALSPLGLLIMLKAKNRATLKFIIATFFSLSIIFAGNELLGISIWSDRLSPLFIFIVTILAAPALVYLLRSVFSRPISRLLVVAVFTFIVVISAWRSNAQVFDFYENPANNARLHPDELSAIKWMNDNLSRDSVVVTTRNTRHPEWIPALTPFQWIALSEKDGFVNNPSGDASDSPTYNKLKYMAFFTLVEDVRPMYSQSPNDYPLVYSNKAISVYNVPARKNETTTTQ